MKSKPEILWILGALNPFHDRRLTLTAVCSVWKYMLSHLQCAALWKWCAVLHPMGIPSPFAIVILAWNVRFLLMPSLLLCTGCHSINHSSSLEFLKTSRVWVLSQTCWIRHARGLSRRVFGFSETSLGHSDAQPGLRTTVSLKIYIYIALWCCFCTAKWISYMFTYIPSFSDFLPI